MKPAADVQRVVAAVLKTGEPPEDNYDEPGSCWVLLGGDHISFTSACPGCGLVFGMAISHNPDPAVHPGWRLVAGEDANPATWTLTPSIFCKGCCQWHGFLVNGVFQLTQS